MAVQQPVGVARAPEEIHGAGSRHHLPGLCVNCEICSLILKAKGDASGGLFEPVFLLGCGPGRRFSHMLVETKYRRALHR